MLAAQGRPGHYSHCGAWLGIMSAQKNHRSDAMAEDELNWQRYVILTVGELLAASPALPSPPGRESFAQEIEEYLEYSADGKASVLARKLHLSREQFAIGSKGYKYRSSNRFFNAATFSVHHLLISSMPTSR